MATPKKIGFPKCGRDTNVANWRNGGLKWSRFDTKRMMRVAHHFEGDTDLYVGCKNPIGT